MSEKPTTTFYDIYNTLPLIIYDFGRGKGLRSFLAPHKIKKAEGDSIDLIICRRKSQLPHRSGITESATYKVIPWTVSINQDSRGNIKRVFFYAPVFVTFLVIWIVLVPLLKRILIEKGGFKLFGSAFQYGQTTFFLIGRPGAGKTRLTLQALEKGGLFLADNVLLILGNGEVRGLFNKIELRYDTARGTPYWSQLTIKNKCRLFLFQIISCISFRYISFHQSIDPAALRIEIARQTSLGNWAVIQLTNEPLMMKTSPDDLIDAIMDDQKWYQSAFGHVFSGNAVGEKAQQRFNMKSFFATAQFGVFPAIPI